MIISRTPFRLSFAGGGTDLPSFYQEEDGAVLSTSLNQYVYITVNKRFDDTIRLSYSKTEICDKADQIQHPIFKYVIKKYAPAGGLEIISMADIPSGTGLGSSSSFTVGVLNAVKNYLKMPVEDTLPEGLAAEASDIEINKLHEPIGKQDQYIASYGGLRYITFRPDGSVKVEAVKCNETKLKQLEANLMMFYTGQTRDAKSVLSEQKQNTNDKRESLRGMAQIAGKLKKVLENSDQKLEGFGKLLNEAWELKKSVASKVSSPKIDEWYERGLKAGASGGKILGAGSGGFLMLFCDPSRQENVKRELKELRLFDANFERDGSRIIFRR